MTSVAVVGAGISGLTAALTLTGAGGPQVTLYESAAAPGGCLARTDLDGHLPGGVDAGAEASLNRRPETRALMAELELEPVHPSTAHGSRILTGAGLGAIPAGTLMGVPGDPEALRGLLSDAGVERVAAEVPTPPVDGDVSCGDFLAARLGDEVVDTLIDPLIGGVYAGRCRELSLAATVPALLPAAREGTSVLAAVGEVLAARTQTQGANIPGASGGSGLAPVFCSLTGGINGLVPALATRLGARGAEVLTGARVRSVTPAAGAGSGAVVRTEGGETAYDHVVLAVPAWSARELLAGTAGPDGADTDGAGDLADLLGRIDYASSAVITALFDDAGDAAGDAGTAHEAGLSGSGFLVPPVLGTLVKASTFSSNKWPWLAGEVPPGRRVVRMSVGRAGDTAWQESGDAELQDRALAEWRTATGYTGSLVHAEVRRWDRALPQYRPGHAQRVEALEAAAAQVPWLSLTGSYLDGVGIPACIGRARAVAGELRAALRT